MIKPIPCRKFKDASMLAWIEKLAEETSEVANEAAGLSCSRCEKLGEVKARKRLAEEITDVITVCVSWLDALWDTTRRRAAGCSGASMRRTKHAGITMKPILDVCCGRGL